ncbi:MAG: septal ring lytic transglycosylase RlpA family protein [Gammaproteobacteria bacterium]|nr:septal ring lytic transglycosylase RlpA family protein [Gammaproteobacteria bacterium]
MSRPRRLFFAGIAVLTALATGCSGKPAPRPATSSPSPYYSDDRPPEHLPVDPDSVADAVPRHEPLSATGNRPYTALGKRYHPLASAAGYVKRGTASWYGRKFHGRRTSSGEPYDMFAMTAAHPVLPLPSYVRVTNLDNGKSVVVRVNDRGPFLHGRIIDLSYMAAHKLGIAGHGTGPVEVRALKPEAPAQSAVPENAGAGRAALPASSAARRIMIQIGAYSRRANAHKVREQLEQAGYRVAVRYGAQGREAPLYRVQVGPFTSRDAARASRQKLEAMLRFPVTFVIE